MEYQSSLIATGSVEMIYQLGKRVPKFADDVFVAENATIIGDVELHSGASVWFNAVLRADNDRIVVGENSNIQDASVLHIDPGLPLVIGKGVTVGHKVMLHGCTIGDNTLIGINAVVLNGARIGRNCLIGAGALITENKEIPDNSMVLGMPGKVVKTLSDKEAATLKMNASFYVENAKRYKAELTPFEGS